MVHFLRYFLLFSIPFLLLSGCVFQKKQSLLINGAGASFPYILYAKWFSEYRKVEDSVAINYQSIGSGGGIRQFLQGTLDFGASDIPLSNKEQASAKHKIVHIPTTLGAVSLTYNLDLPKKTSLKLNGETLAKIFQGKITRWNDKAIQNLNKKIPLPDQSIVVLYRADASGTTSFFTEFLAKSTPLFLKEVGRGKSVPWPVGVGGKGNEGVVGLLSKLKGAIAYVSSSYLSLQNLPVIKIENKSGVFLSPTTSSVMKAAETVMKKKGNNYLLSLIHPLGKSSYPVSGFTYIILSNPLKGEKGKPLVTFLKWALTEGQNFSEKLNFIPLPKSVRAAALKQLAAIQYK